MKRKYIVITIILIVIFSLIGYIIYKSYNISKYEITTDINYETYAKGTTLKEEITLNHTNAEDYVVFNNLKIRNDFKDFVMEEESEVNKKFYKYDSEGNLEASFLMSKIDSYMDMLKKENNPSKIYFDNKLTNEDIKEILERNNIKDDTDIIKYLIKNKDKSVDIFKGIKDIKENYFVKTFISFILPQGESVTIINGDVKGYMINFNDNAKFVTITNKDKSYNITFVKSTYFNDDYVRELLSTIVFE